MPHSFSARQTRKGCGLIIWLCRHECSPEAASHLSPIVPLSCIFLVVCSEIRLGSGVVVFLGPRSVSLSLFLGLARLVWSYSPFGPVPSWSCDPLVRPLPAFFRLKIFKRLTPFRTRHAYHAFANRGGCVCLNIRILSKHVMPVMCLQSRANCNLAFSGRSHPATTCWQPSTGKNSVIAGMWSTFKLANVHKQCDLPFSTLEKKGRARTRNKNAHLRRLICCSFFAAFPCNKCVSWARTAGAAREGFITSG